MLAMPNAPYRIDDTSEIITPALLVFRSLLESNLDQMISMAGEVSRLRPHCKTHKMPDLVKLELSKGIRKHKAATFAEAEMLAEAGVPDVFLAYNLVGPNVQRGGRLSPAFSRCEIRRDCRSSQAGTLLWRRPMQKPV